MTPFKALPRKAREDIIAAGIAEIGRLRELLGDDKASIDKILEGVYIRMSETHAAEGHT